MSWFERTDWAKTVTSLGLQPLPGAGPFQAPVGVSAPGMRLVGTLEGKRVEISLRSHVSIRVPFEPALDVGLSIRPEGIYVHETRRTGHARFDALYSMAADEPERAAALTTPVLLDTLVSLLERSVAVQLADDAVVITGEGEGWLRMAVPLAVEIAHRIDGRRDAVPVPSALAAHRTLLGRLASDRLLRIDDTPIRLAGGSSGVKLLAFVERESFLTFALRARLQLDDALNIDLRVTPSTLLTPLRALLPGQTDQSLGDRALDAAFHVRTSVPDALARALDAEGRSALTTCAAGARSFVLDDSGVTVERVLRADAPSEPAECLRAGLDLLEGLARRIRAAPPTPSTGPFR